jgi:hypothetical protein
VVGQAICLIAEAIRNNALNSRETLPVCDDVTDILVPKVENAGRPWVWISQTLELCSPCPTTTLKLMEDPMSCSVVTPLFCPLCGDRHVRFAGVKADLRIRTTHELVAVFTCTNSHAFFIRSRDVTFCDPTVVTAGVEPSYRVVRRDVAAEVHRCHRAVSRARECARRSQTLVLEMYEVLRTPQLTRRTGDSTVLVQ